MPFTRHHLLLWHELACVEKPARKCAGRGGWNTEQGEESRATRSAAVVGWLLHGPGEFSGADFLDQVDGEKMKKGSERQHTASPLPAPSSASPSVPSIFLRFSINKIWIIRSLRQEEEKKRKIFKDLTVDKKLTPLSSEMDLSFVGLDPYKLVCIDVCRRVWRSLKTKSI